jgi:hypothetical protein
VSTRAISLNFSNYLDLIRFFQHLSAPIFEIIGTPIQTHPNYANFEKMMRVYVGVHNRDTDIKALNTYYVSKIIRVNQFYG